LNSNRWSELEAYSGNASDVPALLRRFAERPDLEVFDDLRARLTGDGDIAATSAFYAALPHIVGILGRVQPRSREEILSQLGWAAALAAFKVPPADIRAAYQIALAQMGDMAAEALHRGANPEFRRYLLAAVAVASREPVAALALVHLDDSLCCPRCGIMLNCPSCNLPLDGVTVFGRGGRVDQS
jgi:hypothetical protein